MTLLNKENMAVSYEIDELMDRIDTLKRGKESFFVTDEDSGARSPNKGKNKALDTHAHPLVDYAKLQLLP